MPDVNEYKKLNEIERKITDGVNSFVLYEFLYLTVLILLFAVLIFFIAEERQWTFYSTFAFISGAVYSMFITFLSIKISISSNFNIIYSSFNNGLKNIYQSCLYASYAISFISISSIIIVYITIIKIYEKIIYDEFYSQNNEPNFLFNSVFAFALGGSMISLFTRVGGGLYAKSAHIGRDLITSVFIIIILAS